MEEKELKSPEQDINEKEEKPSEENKEEKVENPSIVDEVETKRLALLASYKKSRLISRIVTMAVLACVLGACFLITIDHVAAKAVGFSLAGAALIAMIVFYFKGKNKFPNISKVYINEVTELLNNYVFEDKRFKDIQPEPDKKITKAEMALDRLYKEGIDAGSRNSVKATFKDKEFEVTEAAIYYQSENKRATKKVGFLGKYLTFKNDLKFEGRYIFNLKNKEEKNVVDQPNDIEDLEKVYDEDCLEIYAPRKDFKEVFGTEFTKKLREVKIEGPLLNLSFVVWASHTAVYLSYDDSVTTLPFEHPLNKEAIDKYRDDLINVLSLLGKY